MINIPQIDAGKVPVAGPPSVIPQRPFVDPAGVIMQAAQLRQQRDLEQQQINQNSLNSLMNTVQSAQTLQESKRRTDLANAQAQMGHDIAMQKLPFEEAELQSKAAQANAQANMSNMFFGAGSTLSQQMRQPPGPADPSKPPQGVPANMWAIEAQLHNGNMTMDQITNPKGPLSSYAPLIQSMYAVHFPDDSPNKARIQTKLESSPQIFSRMQNYTAVLPQMDTLNKMIDQLPQGNYQNLNGIINEYSNRFGSRASNAFTTQVSRVLLTMRTASPGGTDKVLDQDMQQLSLVKSKEQLRDSLGLLFKDAVNQRNTIDPSHPPVDFMTDTEKSYNLYLNKEGFGGLGNISQQDTSPGGSMMDYFKNLVNGNSAQDQLSQIRAERANRK